MIKDQSIHRKTKIRLKKDKHFEVCESCSHIGCNLDGTDQDQITFGLLFKVSKMSGMKEKLWDNYSSLCGDVSSCLLIFTSAWHWKLMLNCFTASYYLNPRCCIKQELCDLCLTRTVLFFYVLHILLLRCLISVQSWWFQALFLPLGSIVSYIHMSLQLQQVKLHSTCLFDLWSQRHELITNSRSWRSLHEVGSPAANLQYSLPLPLAPLKELLVLLRPLMQELMRLERVERFTLNWSSIASGFPS